MEEPILAGGEKVEILLHSSALKVQFKSYQLNLNLSNGRPRDLCG